MRVEDSLLRLFALGYQLGVLSIQLFLTVLLNVVFLIRNSFFSTREKVNLIQPSLLRHLHDLLTEVTHQLARAAVLCSCFRVTWSVHIIFPFHILNTDGIDDDMDMKIASFVVTIGVGTDEDLMPSEILTAELLPHLMDFLKRQIVVITVSGVKTDDVVMALYITFVLILPVFEICLDALNGISVWGAVDARNDVFLTGNIVTVFIQNGTLALLVVLIFQIKLSRTVVGVLTGTVLNDCYRNSQ